MHFLQEKATYYIETEMLLFITGVSIGHFPLIGDLLFQKFGLVDILKLSSWYQFKIYIFQLGILNYKCCQVIENS